MFQITIIDFFGFIGSFSAVVAVVPQIIHSYRMKSVGDISMGMICNFIICSVSWAVYGFLIQDLLLSLTNCITFCLNITLFILKMRYSK